MSIKITRPTCYQSMRCYVKHDYCSDKNYTVDQKEATVLFNLHYSLQSSSIFENSFASRFSSKFLIFLFISEIKQF